MSETAFEQIGDPHTECPVVFSCEHATNLLPEWTADASDRRLLDDHWGWDIGAADVTRSMVAAAGSVAVLSRYSRLICDPNRHPSEASFVVDEVDGQRLSFNTHVTAAERARRRERYFDPYHGALDSMLRQRTAGRRSALLCAVHSFTPSYRGAAREIEVGILFDIHDAAGIRLRAALDDQGFVTALNQPYSGLEGMIYSARRHGRRFQIPYLELEVRQDLIDRPDRAVAVGARLSSALADAVR